MKMEIVEGLLACIEGNAMKRCRSTPEMLVEVAAQL
jgi:hypothetical protein